MARPAMKAVDKPRRAAFELLRAVEERDAYANLLMPTLLDKYELTDRDAGFATELAYGTLRMQLQHDSIIVANVDRPLDQIDAALLTVLRLGVHQLFHMRVSPHAAVGETVELAKAVVGQSRASYVNAVLRTIAKKSLEQWLDEVLDQDPDRELSVRYSHPQWIVDAFADALGQRDQLASLLAADNEPATVTLAVRDPALLSQLQPTEPPAQPRSPFAVPWKGSLRSIPGLGTASVSVQDEGSQWVALALTRVETPTDKKWLDLCAGPGGKVALLSAIAEERDPSICITANEISQHRADLVQRVVRANTQVVTGDGLHVTGEFDRIMLDAPCSGIGALRRRPEARWRKTPRDVGLLRALQSDLLRHGLTLLSPGGVLAYVTCSPHLAETSQVVTSAIKGRSDLELLEAGDFLPELDNARRGPFVQLWPHLHGTDAMFLALIRRKVQ